MDPDAVRLPIWPEPGADDAARRRAVAIDAARRLPRIASRLDRAIAAVETAEGPDDARIDAALAHLDAYLDALTREARTPLRCRAGCSTCCSDAPPTFPVEARRIAAALDSRGRERAATAAAAMDPRFDDGAGSEAYREAQLQWRARGHPCPALDPDTGHCRVYARRPLSCRVYVAIEDPAHCDPGHPRYHDAERPSRWGTSRELRFEAALLELGARAGLGVTIAPLAIAVTRVTRGS